MRWLLPWLLVPAAAFAQSAPIESKPDVEAPAEPEGPLPDPVETPVIPVEQPLSAADVATAPAPGAESGRLDPVDPGDGTGRKVGRVLLWIPRLPVEITMQPIRGVLYLRDRYHVFSTIAEIFTTEDKKIAVYPTAVIETGFGLNVGARASFKDVFGADERFKLRFGFGGEFRSIAELRFDTNKDSAVSFGLTARLEEKNRERFFGYGNGSETTTPGTMIDPRVDGTAADTRYLIEAGRIAPHLRVQLPEHFAITALGAYLRDTTGPGEDLGGKHTSIEEVFDTSTIPGFGKRTSLYTELEVAWDTRRKAGKYDAAGMYGTGGKVAVFAGRHEGFGDSLTFYRGGLDLQRFIPLTAGPRVLELRFNAEAVSGERDQIPFLELPRLGGERVLRGYERDRFRDRVAAVAQVAYLFQISRFIGASIFVDAGRVYSGLDELSLKDPRVGFGGALEVYSTKSMVVRAELASSIDGGLFGYISLDPWFEPTERTERK